jgi:hypothetical protein
MLANHAPASNDSPQGDSDYEIILTALLETARGRSFLQEYAQRNRATDTATLLTAIGRIEGLLASRSLEPAEPVAAGGVAPPEMAEPSPADTGPPPQAAGASDIDAFAPELIEIESGPSAEVVEDDAVSIECLDAEITSLEVTSLEVTPPQIHAIEFLGPDKPRVAPTPVAAAPQAERTRRAPRDPFADIRALSEEEKIALFT